MDGASAYVPCEQDVLRCLPGLRAVVFRITRNPEATNDLVQDVVLAVIVALRAGRLNDPGALLPYILQAGRNAALMFARGKPCVRFEDIAEGPLPLMDQPLTPLEFCERRELAELARQVLDELPTERDRAIVSQYYVAGIGKPDLMARFGLGKEQFDRVISRARLRMRDRVRARLAEPVPLPQACRGTPHAASIPGGAA